MLVLEIEAGEIRPELVRLVRLTRTSVRTSIDEHMFAKLLIRARPGCAWRSGSSAHGSQGAGPRADATSSSPADTPLVDRRAELRGRRPRGRLEAPASGTISRSATLRPGQHLASCPRVKGSRAGSSIPETKTFSPRKSRRSWSHGNQITTFHSRRSPGRVERRATGAACVAETSASSHDALRPDHDVGRGRSWMSGNAVSSPV